MNIVYGGPSSRLEALDVTDDGEVILHVMERDTPTEIPTHVYQHLRKLKYLVSPALVDEETEDSPAEEEDVEESAQAIVQDEEVKPDGD